MDDKDRDDHSGEDDDIEAIELDDVEDLNTALAALFVAAPEPVEPMEEEEFRRICAEEGGILPAELFWVDTWRSIEEHDEAVLVEDVADVLTSFVQTLNAARLKDFCARCAEAREGEESAITRTEFEQCWNLLRLPTDITTADFFG